MANHRTCYWCRAMFDACKYSVARLDCGQGFCGNGFIVFAGNNTCLMLTCAHAVKKEESNGSTVVSNVSVSFCNGKTFNARVDYVDEHRDLALLRADNVDDASLSPLRFWEDGDVVTGTDVILLSFFTMNGMVLVEPGTFPGKILSEPVVFRKETGKVEEIRLDYISMNGTSGAPVLLPRVNKVVGVNDGAFGTTKTASTVRMIEEALRQWLQTEDVN
uniref:Serine protease n=1 Tax=Oryza brachyantha TaxID=4533 RepID=J3MNV9_ORYBR